MNLHQTLRFDDLRAQVVARADRALPDRTVHVADLRMTDDGHLAAAGTPTYRLNGWSRRQLASLLGIRWEKWFATASPAERAEEVTRRLARTPGEIKVRAWTDPTGEADGIARALLSPSFTPIDDVRIFDRLAATLGRFEDMRFAAIERTDSTTHYTAVRVDAFDPEGDAIRPGWKLRNSEVGGAALTLDDFFLRQVCSNGLLLEVGGKRALYRTHRHIDDDQLAAALVIALGRLPERAAAGMALLNSARTADVPYPDAAVAAVLDDHAIPKALIEEAQTVVLRDGDRTRFGIVQAITYVAHAVNPDPDIRFAMERLAGQYLAAA